MNKTWITGCLPTKDDGDSDGDVLIPHINDDGYEWRHWDEVKTGEPWAPGITMPPFVPPDSAIAELNQPEPTCPADLIPKGCTVEYRGLNWENGGEKTDFIAVGEIYGTSRLINTAPTGVESSHYWEVIKPELVLWSKPSHFPPVCWVMRKEGNCFHVSQPIAFLHVNDLSKWGWAPKPFDNFEDGEPLVIKP